MLKKALIASAVLAAACGAQAQTSAGFGVGGTIDPGTCTVTLSGSNGLTDYGSLSQAYVRSLPVIGNAGTEVYNLPAKTTTLTVSCTSAVKIAMAFVDNRVANRFDYDAWGAQRYGIASAVAGQKLGEFGLAWGGGVAAVTVNGGTVPAGWLATTTGTTAWTSATAATGQRFAPGYTYSPILSASNTTPDAVTSIEGTLEIRPALSKALIDSAVGQTKMDGSGTLSLVYV